MVLPLTSRRSLTTSNRWMLILLLLRGCQAGAAAKLALLTADEVAILDGATVSTAELNLLDGCVATTTQLNYLLCDQWCSNPA